MVKRNANDNSPSIDGCKVTVYTNSGCTQVATDAQNGQQLSGLLIPKGNTGATFFLAEGAKYYYKESDINPNYTFDHVSTDDQTITDASTDKMIGVIDLTALHQPGSTEEGADDIGTYNGSTKDACPNTFIVSSRIDWTPYYEFAITAAMNGEEIPADWTGDLATGSVVLTEVNEQAAAAGTAEAIEEVKAKLESGEIHVFDTSAFTVEGEPLESYMADVDSDPEYTPDTEVISDGYFHESEYRSAPYFDLMIDGITLLDTAF